MWPTLKLHHAAIRGCCDVCSLWNTQVAFPQLINETLLLKMYIFITGNIHNVQYTSKLTHTMPKFSTSQLIKFPTQFSWSNLINPDSDNRDFSVHA